MEIDRAFASVAQVLFGKALSPVADYAPWLLSRIGEEMEFKSAVSGREVYAAPLEYFKGLAGKKIVSLDESLEMGKKTITPPEVDGLGLANAKDILRGISYASTQIAVGQNIKVEKCAGYVNSQFCFKSTYSTECKFAAYSFWPRQSEYVFGTETLLSSKFCVKCHNSAFLSRCFELADSSNCSDSYFCYNSENLRDCMFCFNSKGLRYAIGNVEVGKEKYAEVKRRIVGEIASRLEKDKRLPMDIFSIGC